MDTYKKIFCLFRRRDKIRFILLCILSVFVAFSELASIVSVLPFLAIVSDTSIIHKNEVLSFVFNYLNFSDEYNFLIFIGIMIFILIIFLQFFAAFSNYILEYSRYSFMQSLSIRLLDRYLSQKYEWFLNRNSNDLRKSVLNETSNVVSNSIMPAVAIVARISIVIFIITLLILTDWVLAVIMGLIIGGAYLIIMNFTNRKAKSYGNARVKANKYRFRIVAVAFDGIKDIKLKHLESTYHSSFTSKNWMYMSANAKYKIISQLPRYFLKAVLFGGMMLVILYFLQKYEGGISSFLPILALYALSAVRLLPAVQGLYQILNTIRFGSASLDHIVAELEAAERRTVRGADPAAVEPLRLHSVIEFTSVSYAYPQSSSPAVEDLSFTIRANTTVGVVGGSGAGKTTLVDLLLGLILPQSGAISIDGVPLDETTAKRWQRSIGYVSQSIFLSDGTVAENIALGVPKRNIDRDAVERAARAAHLHDFVVGRLPMGYDSPLGEHAKTLSGGQRQRLAIARALYTDPDVLVLDEATSALDNVTEREVMKAIGALAETRTVVIVAHRLSTVKACDNILHLEHGKVRSSGSYDDLRAQDERFRSYVEAAE